MLIPIQIFITFFTDLFYNKRNILTQGLPLATFFLLLYVPLFQNIRGIFLLMSEFDVIV